MAEIWRSKIEKLKTFKKQFGHCNVPSGWSSDRVLSQWVENIRKGKKLLPDELKKELVKLHFNFDYKVSEDWDAMYEKLEAFYLKQGHAEIPSLHPDYKLLSPWIQKQRLSRKRLSKKYVQKLDEIEFIWEERWAKYKAQWLNSFDKLKSHYLKFSSSWIAWKDRHQFPELTEWCRGQTKRFRRGQLSEDKIKLLNSIEFDWSAGRKKEEEKKWLKQFEDLKKFKAVHGHVRVPAHKKGSRRLYSWIVTNRQRVDLLTDDQRKRLNALGFRWSHEVQDKRKERWSAMYEKLKRFHKKNGHINVTKRQDARLARWLRAQEERASLSKDRSKKLKALGMIWEKERKKSRSAHWDKMYQELKKFYIKNGHCVVPVKNRELRGWIQNLKAWNKSLAPEQRKKLRAIEFSFDWNRNDYIKLRWEKRYEELKNFKKKFGHCNVSKHTGDYTSLGIWIRDQRKRKTKLSPEKTEKLNRIGFPWVAAGRKSSK